MRKLDRISKNDSKPPSLTSLLRTGGAMKTRCQRTLLLLPTREKMAGGRLGGETGGTRAAYQIPNQHPIPRPRIPNARVPIAIRSSRLGQADSLFGSCGHWDFELVGDLSCGAWNFAYRGSILLVALGCGRGS